MTVIFAKEEAKVGTGFTLELETNFAQLASLTTHRIYLKKPNAPATFKSANVHETTKLRVDIDPTDTDRKMNLRTWTYALGTGTAIFKGKTFVVPIIEEDE